MHDRTRSRAIALDIARFRQLADRAADGGLVQLEVPGDPEEFDGREALGLELGRDPRQDTEGAAGETIIASAAADEVPALALAGAHFRPFGCRNGCRDAISWPSTPWHGDGRPAPSSSADGLCELPRVMVVGFDSPWGHCRNLLPFIAFAPSRVSAWVSNRVWRPRSGSPRSPSRSPLSRSAPHRAVSFHPMCGVGSSART